MRAARWPWLKICSNCLSCCSRKMNQQLQNNTNARGQRTLKPQFKFFTLAPSLKRVKEIKRERERIQTEGGIQTRGLLLGLSKTPHSRAECLEEAQKVAHNAAIYPSCDFVHTLPSRAHDERDTKNETCS